MYRKLSTFRYFLKYFLNDEHYLGRSFSTACYIVRVENWLCPQMAGSPSCEIPAT